MAKPLIWIGAALAALGSAALGLFVLPYVGLEITAVGGQGAQSVVSPLIAVLTGATGLAAGFALIGVGVGHWQQPTQSHTLPLGQTHNSSEV